MEETPGNRLKLDEDFEDNAFIYQNEPFLADSVTSERKKNRARILGIAAILLFFISLLGGGLYYYFYHYKPAGDKETSGKKILLDEKTLDPDVLKGRLYFPDSTVSPRLASAVAAYKENDRSRAKRELEKFIESSADDKEKAIALVYLGILALETDRYELAKFNLLRALKYDEKSVPALVNLAIAEQKMGEFKDAEKHIRQAASLSPNDSLISTIAGNLAAGQNLDTAIERYREGINKDKDDPYPHFNLALSLVRKGNYEEAVRHFSRAIEIAGPSEITARSHAHLGQIYFSRGNFELSADHLEKAVKIVPDNGRFLYNLGVVYLSLHDRQRAIDNFNKALKAGAGEASVFRSLAAAYLDLKEPALAVQSLEKALFRNPDDLSSWFLLGDTYLSEGDLLSAAQSYKKIVNITPGDVNTRDALLKLGNVYLQMERFQDAQDIFSKASELDPGNVQASYGRGEALYRNGKKDLAVEEWQKILKNNGGNLPPLERNQERTVRMALGSVYASEGAYDLALAQYRHLQSRNKEMPAVTEDAALSLRFAEIYRRLKDYKNTEIYYNEVIQSRSAAAEERKKAYTGLAKLQSVSGNPDDLSSARANAAKAVRLDPEDQRSRVLQAEILLKTNLLADREKAIEILLAVFSSDVPSDVGADSQNLLGKAYFSNGEYARALRAFEYAVQLNPAHPEAYENQRAASNAYEQSLSR